MPNKLILVLRSVLFYIGYIVTLVPHACFCVLFGIFMPIKLRFKYFVLWNQFSIWWLQTTCNIHYVISGVDNIPDEPFVLLSNHQSPWETIFLYYYFQPLTATLKKQLLLIPFFGWALALLQPIAIDRSKKRNARQLLLTQGKQRLNNGISVLVFPEGTRVDPSQTKKYSTGGAGLAIECNALILPVAHNSGLFWPAHKFVKQPGTVTVNIGKAISSQDKTPRELTEQVQKWIREASN